MRAIRLLAIAVVVGLLGATAGADEKKAEFAKLIVGKWEVTTNTEGKGPPKGAIIEFTKDGKLHITVENNGEKKTMDGTYKLDGDKMTATHKDGDKERTAEITINKIDNTTMAITGPENIMIEFTRKN